MIYMVQFILQSLIFIEDIIRSVFKKKMHLKKHLELMKDIMNFGDAIWSH
jgi:hypothetical protein